MTNQEYNIAVTSVIKLIVSNNAGGVSRALKQAGYPTKDFIPDSELESALFTLYMADVKKFYEVLRKIKWNYGNNNGTNNSDNINTLIDALNKETSSTIDKSNFWNAIVDVLSKQSILQSSVPCKPENSNDISVNKTAIIAISAIVILAIIILTT